MFFLQVNQYTTASSVIDNEVLNNKSGLTPFLKNQLNDLKRLKNVRNKLFSWF